MSLLSVARRALLVTFCLSSLLLAEMVPAEGGRVTKVAEGSFADVKEMLEFAITNQGFVISHFSNIGEMLARTGKDLGADRQVFGAAGVMEFCSASLSRKMMEEDPSNIVFCPYAIALYQLPGDSEKVYLSFDKPSVIAGAASDSILHQVDAVLEEIITEASE